MKIIPVENYGANLPLTNMAGSVDALEIEMLKHEQVSCPVVHRFGPGIYIREVHIKAGTNAVGHWQKFEHTNMMLAGRVLMVNDDGGTRELVAPMFFVGPPGRKVGYITEDMVWQNIYANPTNETDIDKLESMFLDKSHGWQTHAERQCDMDRVQREADRMDYQNLLDESGFAHETAVVQSENEADQIPFPSPIPTLRVLDSPIAGKGLFTTYPILAGAMIAPARIGGMRTPAGRYVNHCMEPNATMVKRENGDIDLIARRCIEGCRGGDKGEEITIDYRQALSLSGIQFNRGEALCLE